MFIISELFFFRKDAFVSFQMWQSNIIPVFIFLSLERYQGEAFETS